MRLSRIKLAGFKSFVDPTTITLPSNLVGIVGPNGCGKSNVIDAVRWVMGEASAKHLRGDSMADVIFNGSASRKAVGTASIELFFDNSDGTVGGQYAQYAEISIKRSISRDGTSLYFLNNTRCRRKDITDLFLGTGLGSRSYAIIEQGMVSRLIEAKPDEMRYFIEEAAGISKYKERRRETENRIQHTRDNLARLNDLRDEVAKQIEYLQRQAKVAERYKEYKKQERRIEAELLAIRLGEIDASLEASRRELGQRQTEMEAAIGTQRHLEAEIVAARERHVEVTEAFNAVQARYYGTQSEISRLEQGIAHARELRERQRSDLSVAEQQSAVLGAEVSKDKEKLAELEATLRALAPDLDRTRQAESAARDALRRAENALEEWQDTWHEFNIEAREYQQAVQVERTRIEHLEAQLASLQRQLTSLEVEQAGIAVAGIEQRLRQQAGVEQRTDARLCALQGQLSEIDREVERMRDRERDMSEEVEKAAADLASRQGQLAALQAVQRAALGADDGALGVWLDKRHIKGEPRLAQRLRVDKAWLRAVETVLGDFLQAVCVTDCAAHIADLPESRLALLEAGESGSEYAAPGSLLAKVGRAGRAAGMLASVRTAETLAEALQVQKSLGPGETVITADGIWLGPGWVRVNRGQQDSSGLLAREEEIRGLVEDVSTRKRLISGMEQSRRELRSRLDELEQARTQLSQEFNAANREHAEALAILDALRGELARTGDRRLALDHDVNRIRCEIAAVKTGIQEARARHDQAARGVGDLTDRRPELQRRQQDLLDSYNDARSAAEALREELARLNIESESRRVSRESVVAGLERVMMQRQQLIERIADLERQIAEGERPIEKMQGELARYLDQGLQVERDLAASRQELELVESRLRFAEGQRASAERAVGSLREGVDALRMQVREMEVRREGMAEQFTATGAALDEVRQALAADATAAQWQISLDDIRRRIDRLGPINLAAIEQFTEQTERKTYLDAQLADLNAALETLEHAIRKIDRETRSRFKETFDNVNQGLKRIFPRLFGGGHAYLSIEGDDILTAGVTVMARPPGKRNSHIHLLSGGEKALTAVALIFAIFELNPAPFCLLDEVDAPLDDANVGRFCEIVREMSQRVQFVVITHNKTTMEMANQLTGVTMNEPGVSRLVSVDLDEAVQLAAS
jgi:chromosome segregation protein